MKISKRIVAKAKKIKLIAMDVDGVLTGGEIIVLESGQEVVQKVPAFLHEAVRKIEADAITQNRKVEP